MAPGLSLKSIYKSDPNPSACWRVWWHPLPLTIRSLLVPCHQTFIPIWPGLWKCSQLMRTTLEITSSLTRCNCHEKLLEAWELFTEVSHSHFQIKHYPGTGIKRTTVLQFSCPCFSSTEIGGCSHLIPSSGQKLRPANCSSKEGHPVITVS